MYIDFQQNRVCRSVKITVHTNIFAQYRKFHKFATTNSNLKKKNNSLDMHHHKTYCISICSKIRTVHTSLFAKNHNNNF